MAKDMNLTAQEIYEKEFHVDLKGYAPAEVDEFLDMVIEDYQKYDEKNEWGMHCGKGKSGVSNHISVSIC